LPLVDQNADVGGIAVARRLRDFLVSGLTADSSIDGPFSGGFFQNA
jgi:hypothetical protein